MNHDELCVKLRKQETHFKRVRTMCQNQANLLRMTNTVDITPTMRRYNNSVATYLEDKIVGLDKLIQDCQELLAAYKESIETDNSERVAADESAEIIAFQ